MYIHLLKNISGIVKINRIRFYLANILLMHAQIMSYIILIVNKKGPEGPHF